MTFAAVAASAVAALAVAIRLFWDKLRGSAKDYDGLAGVISFSSKLIAASRAVESQEPHPLVADPLAEKLAGSAALASSEKRAVAAPAGSERKYKVGKMAIRTRWFDDQIEACLGMPVVANIPACLRDPAATPNLTSYVWMHPSGHEPRQLVMLGAGMDTRPWRMKLPADLDWYELDQPDVLAAKKKLLKDAAAEVPPSGQDEDPAAAPEAVPGSPVASGLTRHLSIDHVQLPLRCGSWTAVPCDLGDNSWADRLVDAGFDVTKPTVWVAEGLLMYLPQDRVEALLNKMADLSAEGSAFVSVSITQAVIDRLKAKKQEGGSSSSGSGGAKGGHGESLMDTWVFGCAEDPTEFFAVNGWRLRLVTERVKMAAALGIAPELCHFSGRTTEAGGAGSLFMVATPNSEEPL